ncbi:MAG: discoidin domain-containing protein, partial [Planctomycetes bacterium]|nr:discoidin domain-containing protein [Planctomycetota bacterium]
LENGNWGKNKITNGYFYSITNNIHPMRGKGYTSDPPHDAQTGHEWVEVNLGAEYYFDQVWLFPRTDIMAAGGISPFFPADFTIRVKPDKGDFKTVKTLTSQSTKGEVRIYDVGLQHAKLVRIDVTKLGVPPTGEAGHRLQLAEIEIYNTMEDSLPASVRNRKRVIPVTQLYKPIVFRGNALEGGIFGGIFVLSDIRGKTVFKSS